MLKNVTITEPPGLLAGSLNAMLHNMGVHQFQEVSPGVTKAQFTDANIAYFRTRGFSYKLDVEEVPVQDPKDARIAELEASLQSQTRRAEMLLHLKDEYYSLLSATRSAIGCDQFPKLVPDDLNARIIAVIGDGIQ